MTGIKVAESLLLSGQGTKNMFIVSSSMAPNTHWPCRHKPDAFDGIFFYQIWACSISMPLIPSLVSAVSISLWIPQQNWYQSVLVLTHWGRDKMATIFQTAFSSAFSWMKMYEFRLRFHSSLYGPINNISALVQIMAWCQIGTEPLSEPNMTQFSDTYMHHPASMS